MEIQSVSGFCGTSASVPPDPPTHRPVSYSRVNPDAIVLTNRNPAQCACRGAASSCAGHVQQFGGESPPANLMEVKA